MGYRCVIEDERCNSVVPEHATFYTTVIERGVEIPLHPFFIEILDFYNLAPDLTFFSIMVSYAGHLNFVSSGRDGGFPH